MKAAPPGWSRISSAIFYDDANAAIDWLCKAFGFELRLKVASDDGGVKHSELTFGDGVIMVSSCGPSRGDEYSWMRTPTQVSRGNTQSLFVYVEDIDAHCKRARDAGGKVVNEPTVHDYGDDYWADKSYECVDIGGHHWWFAERVKGAGATK